MLENKSIAPIRLIDRRSQHPSCHVVVANYGGGMVDGDRVCLELVCREGARLNLGSVGNLHVYKSRTKGCSFAMKGYLERNALCVCSPDPVILHSGSRFEQKQYWKVHPESSLLATEWMIAGRLETGECFDFDEYVSELTVIMDGRPLIAERFEFRPDQLDYRDPALFGGLACLLNVYMVGHEWAALADLLSATLDRLREADPRQLAAVYPIEQSGYILRGLSADKGGLTWITDTISQFLSSDRYLGFNPLERKY